MLRRAFSICAVLGLASAAHAGVIVTLVPTEAQPPAGYAQNQVVHVNVMAQLNAAIPSPAPGNPGARLRLAQFDLSDTNPALHVAPSITHVGADVGDISFWDFSTTSGCSGDPASCGFNSFIDGSLTDSTPTILNTTYIGSTTSGAFQIRPLAASAIVIGQLDVTMPGQGGVFLLDVLNADEADINKGAEFRHGFGTGTDPSVTYRANAGTVSDGQFRFLVVPEPATLALLGLGGLAAAFRRRRSA